MQTIVIYAVIIHSTAHSEKIQNWFKSYVSLADPRDSVKQVDTESNSKNVSEFESH